MDEKILKQLEKKLKEKKQKIEESLKDFANKDKKLKGDWDTKYPKFEESSGDKLEEASDEVEEYANLLPVEHSLELQLEKINKALEKIKKGDYGLCEKCKKEISIGRLKAFPEASFCNKCK